MLKRYLQTMVEGGDLEPDDASEAMRILMAGKADPVQVAALLIAWRMKGETAGEILGCARILRQRAAKFGPVPDNTVDTCGTGGDGAGTFNISTVAALVAAAAGVPIAKHGNRAVSSRCGSADLLEALGMKLEIGTDAALRCLRETRFAFLYAPAFHGAMRHVAPVRRVLGTRTIFNLLGPLVNPAGVRRQVMGVFHSRYLMPIAEALRGLGSEHVMVVHSRDGLDEFSVCDETDLVESGPGATALRRRRVRPEDFGLTRRQPGDLSGGDAERNAAIALEILEGRPGACRDAVVFNAGAALVVGGAAGSIGEGIERACRAIDSGDGMKIVRRLRVLTSQGMK